MSYDLQFRRYNGIKEPLDTQIFTALEDDFEVKITRETENHKVLSFSIKFKRNQPIWIEEGFDFAWQEAGYYWSYISYSANEEMWTYFTKLTDEVADALKLEIFDPQLQTEENTTKRTNNLNFEQKETYDREWMIKTLNEPTEMEYDYRLFIYADDPHSGHAETLFENGEGVYTESVQKGEVLRDKLKLTLAMLTGSSDYKDLSILKVKKTLSQEITNKPLFDVQVAINYFDPTARKLKYNMKWVRLADEIKTLKDES